MLPRRPNFKDSEARKLNLFANICKNNALVHKIRELVYKKIANLSLGSDHWALK